MKPTTPHHYSFIHQSLTNYKLILSKIVSKKTTRMILASLIFIHITITLTSASPSPTGKISTRTMDVTQPITTVPTITPATSINNHPMAQPTTTTTTPLSSSSSPGRSWCVASQSASQTALQVALDYACGYGGADCSEIQQGGGCFNPDTLRHHASYAFNSYYQKNPIPSSCKFGGTAITTSTDPSSSTCQFPATSTSSSVLNTTNSKGSTVFGSGPSVPSSNASLTLLSNTTNCLFLIISFFYTFVVF